MKKYLLISFISSFLLTIPKAAFSSHAVGADITYEYIDSLRYKVVVKLTTPRKSHVSR